MARTYEPIASTTVSAASSATFSGIAATYTDLVVVYALTHSTGVPNMFMRFNGDTGNNFSLTALSGDGSSALAYRSSNRANILIDQYAYAGTSAQSINVINVMSYANTNVFKTVLAAAARAGSGVDRIVGLWRSTSSITSVMVAPVSGTITGDLALYGIKAA